MTGEWVAWHRQYESDPTMAERLRVVRSRIREALDRAGPGPIRVVSACAGDGRDLLGVLANHPRARDVRARLVERTPDLARAGAKGAKRLGLPSVRFRRGDASNSSAYAGAVPADLVLLCGIFGNLRDADVRHTIRRVRGLCAANATVVWTRGRFAPDLTPKIRRWFAEEGFDELSFVTVPGSTKSVGAHRLVAPPRRYRRGVRLFTFLARGQRPSDRAAGRTTPRPRRQRPERGRATDG